VLLNLIHDVDLLRYLVGEVEDLQAAQSNRIRGNEIEDVRHDENHPTAGGVAGPWYSLDYTYVLERGPTILPNRRSSEFGIEAKWLEFGNYRFGRGRTFAERTAIVSKGRRAGLGRTAATGAIADVQGRGGAPRIRRGCAKTVRGSGASLIFEACGLAE
jgi:hypothetical protein